MNSYIRRDGGVLLFFFAASLLALYPVLPALNLAVLGWNGDNLQYVYMIGWVAQAVAQGISPFVDPRLNYPDSLLLAATDAPFLTMIAIAPLTWSSNHVFAYNTLIFLSHFLSGYFAYLWIRQISGSRFGGMVAGLIFLLSPMRIAHSYGHLHLISTQFMLLFFWTLDRALETERPKAGRVVLVGVALFLVSSGSGQYYLIINLLCGLVYALCRVWNLGYLLRFGWQFAASVGVGAFLGALPYLMASRDAIYEGYSTGLARYWSPDLLDLVIPSRLHPLWGEWIEQHYPNGLWIEHTLYLGVAAGVLALAALCYPAATGHARRRAWLGTALFSLILTLGTDLQVGGNPLQPENPVWLPVYYLVQLPFLDFMRVWARTGIVLILFTALFAGLGTAALQRRFGWGRLPMLTCILLILIDFCPGRLSTFEVAPRQVDQWLAQQPGEMAVAFLPAGVDNYRAMVGSLLHGKRMPAYNHPTHMPQAIRKFTEETANFPDSLSVSALQDYHIRFLLLHRASFDGVSYPDWQSVQVALSTFATLRVVAELDEYTVVEIMD